MFFSISLSVACEFFTFFEFVRVRLQPCWVALTYVSRRLNKVKNSQDILKLLEQTQKKAKERTANHIFCFWVSVETFSRFPSNLYFFIGVFSRQTSMSLITIKFVWDISSQSVGRRPPPPPPSRPSPPPPHHPPRPLPLLVSLSTNNFHASVQ